jgi:hypothetical protein
MSSNIDKNYTNSNDDNNMLVKAEDKIAASTGACNLLRRIRPEWANKTLIKRVERLLTVDPSSACQRLFNAAMHDLRKKIVIAGIDLANEAASTNKLPTITKNEDILDHYSTSNILDLAYHIGILSRPEWRRLRRCYEIRRDLEHEDDEYEAGIEDIIYIFKSCVELVLEKDPIELLKVSDISDVIDSPTQVVPTPEFLHDYEKAPHPRQKEIMQLLINTALNSRKADITRQNAMEMLRSFNKLTHQTVKIEIGKIIQDRVGRKPIDLVTAKVASASGIMPYLKQRQVKDLFETFHSRLINIGYQWQKFSDHASILEEFEDIGGLECCPKEIQSKIVLWLTLCYLGEPGGYGTMGRYRKVFYSDTAAPIIKRIFKNAGSIVEADLKAAKKDKIVYEALNNKFIARRYEGIIDIIHGNLEE